MTNRDYISTEGPVFGRGHSATVDFSFDVAHFVENWFCFDTRQIYKLML